MTPNAARAGMARPGASIAVAGALLAAPALAGDRALMDFIGYSDDGRYFAFEEYGIQDGSGFPYSNIYVIDLPADKWVAGSPYRARIETDDATADMARRDARALAAAKLEALDLSVPADLVAHNGDGETGGNAYSLAFGRPGYGLDEPRDVRTLELEVFAADSSEPCETYLGERAKGYALLLDGAQLHRDTTLPRSRGCPLDYRIHGVVMPADWSGLTAGVAIVAVYPFGFEGPDRRFIAVPLDR